MADRSAKLRKLNSFRRSLPHCTASALSAILAEVNENGVPDGVHTSEEYARKSLRQARDLQNKEMTPYGPILQTQPIYDKHDVVQQLTVANPIALLWTASSQYSIFSAFFLRLLKKTPPSIDEPWHILLYSDEVTPGNPLATLNNRKFHAIYWSFLEFGVNALSREESWFCVAVEYSIFVSEFSAGLSQVMTVVIKLFFSEGANLALSGVLLSFVGGESVRLWAKIGGTLQDGGAHKSMFHSRGDGASKFCLLCKNLFEQTSQLVEMDGTNLLACDVLKYEGLVLASSKDLRKTARYIEGKHATMPAGAFTILQQSLGMTYHKHALLLDRSLDDLYDPVPGYMHDWMHALFVDGIYNTTLYLLFESFLQAGKPDIYTVFSDFVAKWTWPARVNMHGRHLPDIFAGNRKKKHRAAKHIKCQASDGLSLVGVSALFVNKVLLKMDPPCKNECDCFLALVEVIEIIVASARVTVQPQTLLTSVEKFLHMYKDAWGCDMMVPKFHWLLHLWTILQKYGTLLNCFCLERKHRVPKRYATELTNISKKNSKSLLMEVTSHHLGQLDQHDAFNFEVGLVNGSTPSKKIKQILIAAFDLQPGDDTVQSIKYSVQSRFSPLATCRKGDLVLFKNDSEVRVGRINLHCEIFGLPISMISEFDNRNFEPACGHSVWTPRPDSNSFIQTDAIIDTVVYSERTNGDVAVLIPWELR